MAAIPASAQQQDHGALRLLIGASAVFVVLTAGLYAWTISWMWPFPRDGSTLVVGRDFLNFWMYGQTAERCGDEHDARRVGPVLPG